MSLFYNPMDWSPPGPSVHGISQARILEWVAVSCSRGSSWPRDRTASLALAGGFFITELKNNLFWSLKIGHRMQHLSEGSKGRQVGSGGDGERWGSDRGSRGSLNEQIALVLMRLQEDMQNVLQRLHKLEMLAASQVGFCICLVLICCWSCQIVCSWNLC